MPRRATIEPARNKVGSEWYVRMRRPDGETHISGFKSEEEARRWIKNESTAWLKKLEDDQLP
jgi:hypothetical protein